MVTIGTDRTVHEVTVGLTGITFRVKVTMAQVYLLEYGSFAARQMTATRARETLAGRDPLPNLVELMSDLVEHTSPPTYLTWRTMLRIIREAPDPQAMVNSPTELSVEAVKLIKTKLAEQLLDGIQYKPIDEWYQ